MRSKIGLNRLGTIARSRTPMVITDEMMSDSRLIWRRR